MKKIEEIMEELKNEAEYIGEDGDMVVNATNEEEALEMFKKRYIEDTSEKEWEEFLTNFIGGIENSIGCAWVHLAPSRKWSLEHDDCEWYVTYIKQNEYQVYYLAA